MQLPAWIQPTRILRERGLVLGVLNLSLAVLCGITFVGVLAATLILSVWLQSYTGNPRLSVPFPWYALLPLFVVAFLVMWIRFARGLQPEPRSRLVRTGLLGAAPLFGLSLIGYMAVAWTSATGDFGPNSMLEAAVFIYGVLSTLILFAGVTCALIVTWFSPQQHP
jgi:MFS family permease